jgi:hypothetical protein
MSDSKCEKYRVEGKDREIAALFTISILTELMKAPPKFHQDRRKCAAVQYGGTVRQYSAAVQYGGTVRQYSAAVQYGGTVRRYSAAVQCGSTVRQYSAAVQYGSTVRRYSTQKVK